MARIVLTVLLGILALQSPLPSPVPALPDPEVGAVVLRAEDTKRVAPLQPLLADSRPEVRRRAALAIARIGLPTGAEPALALLDDPDDGVRRQAAYALGRLQLDLAGSRESVLRERIRPALASALEDPPVAPVAAWSLGRIGGAREVLARALDRVDATDRPELAVRLLGAWAETEGGRADSVERFVEADDPAVRLAAARALLRLDQPVGLAALEKLLDDPEPEIRAAAIEGLDEAPRRLVESRAVELLRDADRRVQCAAAGWLRDSWAGRPDEPPSDAAFTAALRRSLDRSPVVEICALEALGAVLSSRAVAADRLLEALEDPEPAVRAAALEALARSDERRLLEHAWERFAAGDPARLVRPPLRWDTVVRLAVASGAETGEDLLRRALGGAPEEREAALRQLAAIAPARAVGVAETLWEDDDFDARALGVRTLSRLALAGDTELSVERIDGAWRAYWDLRAAPGTVGLRAAALQLLLVHAPEMLERRAELLAADPDRILRFRALRGIPAERREAVATPDTLARASTVEDYEALARRILALQREPPRLRLSTDRGDVVLELMAAWAPRTALRFLDLVESGRLGETRFHRVLPGFLVQGGLLDPPAPALPGEESLIEFRAGTVGLALGERDTGSSQLFVLRADRPDLFGHYPAFGRVIEGQRALDRILPGDEATLRVER